MMPDEYLEDFQHAQHVRAYIFDPSGREITGRLAPPWVEDMAPHRAVVSSQLDRQSVAGPNVPAVAGLRTGSRYTLVVELPPGPRVFFGPHGIPGLGITILVISSGLVCYLLAWSMTSPVTRLRQAAQRLAAGDLSARAGAPLRGRRDELAQLMRDFDQMAERIESLVEAQSRLLKDVSHELRSPLARLSVALGLARHRGGAGIGKRAEPDRAGDGPAEPAHSAAAHDLQAGGGNGRPAPNAGCLSRELVEQVAATPTTRRPGRCRVSADDSDEYLVDADPDLLRSAIENVVRNATRYTTTAPQSKSGWSGRALTPAGDIVVRVLDSGPAFHRRTWRGSSSPFTAWTTPATARPAAQVWDYPSRIGPSGCMAAWCAHPTVRKAG